MADKEAIEVPLLQPEWLFRAFIRFHNRLVRSLRGLTGEEEDNA